MIATLWLMFFVQCLILILLFIFLIYQHKEINRHTRQVMYELLQSVQDKQPSQRPFFEQHAKNTQAIVKRALSTGQWPEDEPRSKG